MQYLKRLAALLLFTGTAAIAAGQLTYAQLWVGYQQAATCNNLQIIPVFYNAGVINNATAPPQNVLTLQQALGMRQVKLQEMPYKNGADINWLQITNKTSQNILVQSGELLAGGKQDRVVADTKIILPGSTDYLHVYCVEKRRWDNKPKDFVYAGTANSLLRKAMDVSGRQQMVWKEIDRQFNTHTLTSPTYSYLQISKNETITDTACLHYFTKWYRQQNNRCAGFIFVTGRQIIHCELFTAAWQANWLFNNMLQANLKTAMAAGEPPVMPQSLITQFADSLLQSEDRQKIFLSTHGKYQMQGGKVSHLTAYGY